MSDIIPQIEDLVSRLGKIKIKLNPDQRARQIAELESKTQEPDFWSDQESAQASMKRLAALQTEGKEIADLEKDLDDAQSVAEILEEKDLKRLTKKLGQLEIRTFLNGPYDNHNAILSVHAGQGGTEAMDWASMLLRMYLRFCQNRGWDVEIVDQAPGEEAGLKSVTVTVTGPYAYGYLIGERERTAWCANLLSTPTIFAKLLLPWSKSYRNWKNPTLATLSLSPMTFSSKLTGPPATAAKT